MFQRSFCCVHQPRGKLSRSPTEIQDSTENSFGGDSLMKINAQVFRSFLSFSPFASRRRKRIARFEKNSILSNNKNNVRKSLPQNYDFNPVERRIECDSMESQSLMHYVWKYFLYPCSICLHFCLVSLDLFAIIHDSRSKSHITRNKCTLIGPIDSTELNLQVTKVTLNENFGREPNVRTFHVVGVKKWRKTNPNLSEVECGTQLPDDFPTSESFPQQSAATMKRRWKRDMGLEKSSVRLEGWKA